MIAHSLSSNYLKAFIIKRKIAWLTKFWSSCSSSWRSRAYSECWASEKLLRVKTLSGLNCNNFSKVLISQILLWVLKISQDMTVKIFLNWLWEHVLGASMPTGQARVIGAHLAGPSSKKMWMQNEFVQRYWMIAYGWIFTACHETNTW